MQIPFIKMHGLGNDYVYIDCCVPETAQMLAEVDLHSLARNISDRHRGVGSDGLVLILPSQIADLRMRMFNADGSEAEMCGNASRCVAKYGFEQGLCDSQMTLETLAGLKHLSIQTTREKTITGVTVDMGKVMGNPHQVLFVDSLDALNTHFEYIQKADDWAEERKQTNIECVCVLNRKEVQMRVCERGTGETMACGTGACATVMAAVEKGLTDRQVTVHMLGGDLLVRIDEDGEVYMTGPATEVFRGIYTWEEKQ